MSKFLIHFQDQLRATSNPDPLLDFYVEYDTVDDWGCPGAKKLQKDRTRKSQMVGDLVGMRFTRMEQTIPVFISELVDA